MKYVEIEPFTYNLGGERSHYGLHYNKDCVKRRVLTWLWISTSVSAASQRGMLANIGPANGRTGWSGSACRTSSE